jgi:hypothetical protein
MFDLGGGYEMEFPFVDDKTFQELLDEGWTKVGYRAIRSGIDDRGMVDKQLAFGSFLVTKGLNINRPIKVAYHFDSRTFAMTHRDDGELLNADDFDNPPTRLKTT